MTTLIKQKNFCKIPSIFLQVHFVRETFEIMRKKLSLPLSPSYPSSTAT